MLLLSSVISGCGSWTAGAVLARSGSHLQTDSGCVSASLLRSLCRGSSLLHTWECELLRSLSSWWTLWWGKSRLPPSGKSHYREPPSPVGLRWDSHAPWLTCDRAIHRPMLCWPTWTTLSCRLPPGSWAFVPPRPLAKPLLEICRPQESHSLMDCPITPPTSPQLSALVLFPPP